MSSTPSPLSLIVTPGPVSYALLDTGQGRKLERFGGVIVDRPEPQAMWQPGLARAEWSKANAVFSASAEDEEKGRWRIDKPVAEFWPVEVERIMRLELADAARRVRQELDSAVVEFGYFRRSAQQAAADSFDHMGEKIDEIATRRRHLPHVVENCLDVLLLQVDERPSANR